MIILTVTKIYLNLQNLKYFCLKQTLLSITALNIFKYKISEIFLSQ